MTRTAKNSDAKADTVPRLVRFSADDDAWLTAKAQEKAKARGRATVQDCVREIIRQAREAETTVAV